MQLANELGWAQVRNYVKERNCDGSFMVNGFSLMIINVTEEAIVNVITNLWNIYCNKIMIENEYWKSGGIVSVMRVFNLLSLSKEREAIAIVIVNLVPPTVARV